MAIPFSLSAANLLVKLEVCRGFYRGNGGKIRRLGPPGNSPDLAIQLGEPDEVMRHAPPTAPITFSVIGIVTSSKSTALLE